MTDYLWLRRGLWPSRMLCRSTTALQLTKLTLHFTHLLLQYLEFGVTFAKLLLKLPLCLHSILFHLVEVVSRALQLMLQPFQLHGRCAVKLRAIPKAVQIVPHIVTAAEGDCTRQHGQASSAGTQQEIARDCRGWLACVEKHAKNDELKCQRVAKDLDHLNRPAHCNEEVWNNIFLQIIH